MKLYFSNTKFHVFFLRFIDILQFPVFPCLEFFIVIFHFPEWVGTLSTACCYLPAARRPEVSLMCSLPPTHTSTPPATVQYQTLSLNSPTFIHKLAPFGTSFALFQSSYEYNLVKKSHLFIFYFQSYFQFIHVLY